MMRFDLPIPIIDDGLFGDVVASDGCGYAVANVAKEPRPTSDVVTLGVAEQAVPGDRLAFVGWRLTGERSRLPLRSAVVAEIVVPNPDILPRLPMTGAFRVGVSRKFRLRHGRQSSGTESVSPARQPDPWPA